MPVESTLNRINISELILEVRNQLELTQEELATALGKPTNTIARWERGEMACESELMLELALKQLLITPKLTHYKDGDQVLCVANFVENADLQRMMVHTPDNKCVFTLSLSVKNRKQAFATAAKLMQMAITLRNYYERQEVVATSNVNE